MCLSHGPCARFLPNSEWNLERLPSRDGIKFIYIIMTLYMYAIYTSPIFLFRMLCFNMPGNI